MDKISVVGGNRLLGSVVISGAKNAALPLMVASLLAKGKTILNNVPHLKDVTTLSELLKVIGAKVERKDNSLIIDTSGELIAEAPYELVKKMRASIYVLGPLLARFGKAKVSLPGGCAWGPRPVDLHIKAMEALGAKIEVEAGYILAEGKLKGATYVFDMVSVGATGNALMACVLAEGITVLENVAIEPEIINLADMLVAMGAKIDGIGTRSMTVKGVERLNAIEFDVIPDRIEAGTYMAAAAMTKGELVLKNVNSHHLDAVISKMEEAGAIIERGESTLFIKGPEKLKSVNVRTEVYPGFPTDMQAQWIAMMTVADGASIIEDTIYHDRFSHVAEMCRLGADIKITNNVAFVKGKNSLKSAPVMSTDLRASASLILCGFVAEGETEISRIYHLDRGYEKIEKKFEGVGANIRRVKEKMKFD